MDFEPKDWITLGASLSAFCIALATYLQRAKSDQMGFPQATNRHHRASCGTQCRCCQISCIAR
jgi:hypothetical protein